MPKTAVGLFENADVAEQVAHDLEAGGFPRSEIRVLKEPLSMPVTDGSMVPRTDFAVGLGRELETMGASAEEANAYVEGVRLGGVLVFATGSGEDVDRAAETMNLHGGKEVEEVTGREPRAQAAGGSLPLDRAGVTVKRGMQTGRIRQSGDGVRMFVW